MTTPQTAAAGTEAPTNPTPPAVAAQPAPATADRAADEAYARAMGRRAQVSDETVNAILAVATTREQINAALVAAQPERGTLPIRTTTVQIGESGDDPIVRRGWMAENLAGTIVPSLKPSDAARQFGVLSFAGIARQCLEMRGERTFGLSDGELLRRAGLMATSDFIAVLADSANKIMRPAFSAPTSGILQLASQGSVRDFKPVTYLQMGNVSTLQEVGEHGEVKRGSIDESKESIRVSRYALILALTYKALANDDKNAFATLVRRMGNSALAFQAQQLAALLALNSGNGPTMDDTNPLFHTAHANKGSSGGAPDETRVGAGRLAMRKQTYGQEPINVAPWALLVPPELETTAEKLLSAIQAATTATVNPFAGKLQLVVEPRLASAQRWYIVADPALIDGLKYFYTDDAPGPQIESRMGFDVDGTEFKISLNFGCGFVEHRSWYLNPGA